MRHLRSLGLVIVMCGFIACADSPEDRYDGAFKAGKVASKSKDRKSTANSLLEDYLLYFTKASAELLRSTHQVGIRRPSFKYVGDVRTILPKAKAEKVEVRGNLAILTMKGENEKFTLFMVQEKGNWVIDLFSMKQFWAPLISTEGG